MTPGVPPNGQAAATLEAVAADAYRLAARRFASGVTVVTTRQGRLVHGGTVSAFFTLSMQPLQVLISLGKAGRLAELIRQSGVYAVNVLAADQEAVSRAFASPGRPTCEDAFPGIPSVDGPTGSPVLDGCLASFDCTVAGMVDSGDHTLFIGDVRAVGSANGRPLLYFDGAYHQLAAGADPL